MDAITKVEGVEKKLYAPVVKSAKGEYVAVLSDTSLDRDEEFIGKKFLESAASQEFLPGLLDHENKALNTVCEWVNKRVEKNGEHYCLRAEPKFYLSNPNAQILKAMLDEGARIGISITAIPKSKREVEKNGNKYTEYVDGEMMSADWVGIPANKNACGEKVLAKHFATAKGFLEKEQKGETVTEETTKGFDAEEFKKSLMTEVKEVVSSALAKNKEDRLDTLEKSLGELTELVKNLQKSEGEESASEESEGSEETEGETAEKKAKTREEKLDDLRKTPSAAGNSQEEHAETKKSLEKSEDIEVSANAFLKAYSGVKAE